MGIKEQMEAAERIEKFDAESRMINDDIHSLFKEIINRIKEFEEKICNEIKTKILEQGKSNNFDVTERGNKWTMKYGNLEYNGDLSSTVKYMERNNGTSYSKVEFILEPRKQLPNRNISLTGPYKDIFEQKEKKIIAEKSILEALRNYKETLNETDITINYQMGKRDSFIASLVSQEQKDNFKPIKADELIKIIIG